MKKQICGILLLAALQLLGGQVLLAQGTVPVKADVQPVPKFIYVLKLMPQYQQEANWTDEANKIVADHFNRLKQLTKDGQVIMAGRTDYGVDHAATFGIVVFQAKDMDAARALMNSDPAVKHIIMSAEVHPFSLALMKGEVQK